MPKHRQTPPVCYSHGNGQNGNGLGYIRLCWSTAESHVLGTGGCILKVDRDTPNDVLHSHSHHSALEDSVCSVWVARDDYHGQWAVF